MLMGVLLAVFGVVSSSLLSVVALRGGPIDLLAFPVGFSVAGTLLFLLARVRTVELDWENKVIREHGRGCVREHPFSSVFKVYEREVNWGPRTEVDVELIMQRGTHTIRLMTRWLDSAERQRIVQRLSPFAR